MDENQNNNEILQYINEHGIENKDVQRIQKKSKRRTISNRKVSGNRKVIDLHGKTADQAATILKSSFRTCKINGINSLLIIHGKGFSSDPEDGPVLKKLVYTMLNGELREYVRDYSFALPRDGGHGATLVSIW